jgi:hypothetical protein
MLAQTEIIHSLAELLDVKTRAEATKVPVPQSVNDLIEALAKLANAQVGTSKTDG